MDALSAFASLSSAANLVGGAVSSVMSGEEYSYEQIPDSQFPERYGNRVSLFQDAHVGDSLLPASIAREELEQDAFDAIYKAILEAKDFILITGWSVDTDTALLRYPEQDPEDKRQLLTLGELLLRKAHEGVKVQIHVWDELASVDVAPGVKFAGMMGTSDEKTAAFFKGSPVEVLLSYREGPGGTEKMFFTHHQKTVIVDAPLDSEFDSTLYRQATKGHRSAYAVNGGDGAASRPPSRRRRRNIRSRAINLDADDDEEEEEEEDHREELEEEVEPEEEQRERRQTHEAHPREDHPRFSDTKHAEEEQRNSIMEVASPCRSSGSRLPEPLPEVQEFHSPAASRALEAKMAVLSEEMNSRGAAHQRQLQALLEETTRLQEQIQAPASASPGLQGTPQRSHRLSGTPEASGSRKRAPKTPSRRDLVLTDSWESREATRKMMYSDLYPEDFAVNMQRRTTPKKPQADCQREQTVSTFRRSLSESDESELSPHQHMQCSREWWHQQRQMLIQDIERQISENDFL
mmetsp:Transcript_129345/g.182369  ORF Transcript_129345/g.182369 Transcript_129345/m.182369 type:complete len:520 (-) Transcript_129345:61-1620(-)